MLRPKLHRIVPDLLLKLSRRCPSTPSTMFWNSDKKAARRGTHRGARVSDGRHQSFLHFDANLGYPIAEERDVFVDDSVAAEVLDRLHALIALAHPKSVEWNPIQVYDFMIPAAPKRSTVLTDSDIRITPAWEIHRA